MRIGNVNKIEKIRETKDDHPTLKLQYFSTMYVNHLIT